VHSILTFDDVIRDWRETSLVCNIDIMDVILSSDAEYLMLTFRVKAFKKVKPSGVTVISSLYEISE